MASLNVDTMDRGSTFTALFWEAVGAYQAETKRNLNLDSLTTLKTPDDLLAYIESQGESFQDFRNKHGKLWTRMYAVLQPVAAVGSIAKTAINSFPPFGPPASAVLGAALHLVTAAHGVRDAYDWIQTLFGEFEMFAIRLQKYISASHDTNPALKDRLGAILIYMLRLFGTAEALIKGGRFREYLKVAFMGKDDRTKGLLDELNVQLKNEQGLIIALTFNATKKVEDYSRSAAESANRIEDQLQDIKLGNAELIAKLEKQKREEVSVEKIKRLKQILETQTADTVAQLLSTQRRDLVGGTGAWLEREALFGTWRSGRAPIIWILGGPGSGKTFLATWTIIHLQEYFGQRTGSSTQTVVAYFFIKDNDAALLEPNNILKTLALQIADADEEFARYGASRCMDRSATITEDETWENLFLGFYSSAEAKDHYAIIILDGLDEAATSVRKKLLAMVKSVTNNSKGGRLGDRIQFAIFGRTELRSDFEFTQQEKFIMVSLKNRDDIKNFVLSKLSNITLVKYMESKGPTVRKQTAKMRGTITRKVLHGADGVFLWAKLLMKELEDLNSVQMGKALKTPPQSLDEMISKLFKRIAQDESVDTIDVSRMMSIMCFARRPLLFGELKLFLSLPSRPPDVLLWRNIRGRFASLFELKYPVWYNIDVIHGGEDEDDTVSDLAAEGDTVLAREETVNIILADEENVHDEKVIDHNIEAFSTDGNGDVPVDENDDEGEGVSVDKNRDKVKDEDSDTESDFDFGDEGFIETTSYDLGKTPIGDKDAREYSHTIHDDDGQLMTSIRFTHQRIKDFLTAEGSHPSKHVPSNEIRVDVQRAEIDMTICCLQALQLGHEQKAHRAYLVEYAGRHFIAHLANVQERYLTVEDTREIILGLVNLFSDAQNSKAILIAANPLIDEEDGGRDDFWNMWLGSQTHQAVVQRWLRKPEVNGIVVDQSIRAWVQQACTSSRVLLEPMMRGASQIWLTKTGYDDEGYRDRSEWLVDVLRAFVSMDESGTVTDDKYQNWSWLHRNCQPSVTSGQLYEIANWAGLEKSTHWHTGLGWILTTFSFHEEAVTEYDKAIEQDSKAWVAMEGKAHSLKYLKNHEEAIVLMNRAIENLPPSMIKIGSFLYPWISRLKQDIGDKQGAHEAAVQALQLDSGSLPAQRQYISTLCDIGDSSQDVVNLLDQLHGAQADAGYSWLVRFFCHTYDMYDEIGLACKECGAPSFVLEAIEKALGESQDKTGKYQLVVMTTHAAHFHYRYYSHDNKAVELLEKALRISSEGLFDGQKYNGDLNYRNIIQNSLSLILFDMAVAAKSTNQGYSRLSTRLKELSVALDSSLDNHSFEFYNTGYPSLLWGRWLREHAGADESVWRNPFRARLLDQINMLDDDDPANDSYALIAVAKSLFHAGDRENAGAILAIIFKLLGDSIEERDAHLACGCIALEDEEDKGTTGGEQAVNDDLTDIQGKIEELSQPANPSQKSFVGPQEHILDPTSSSSQPDPKLVKAQPDGTDLKLQVNKDDWFCTCNNCGRDAEQVTEMYLCEICDDKNWCDECLPLVREGSLPRRDCNPEHIFYRAWPVPEESRHTAATWLQGEPRLRREWLEALRAPWL